MKDNFYGNPHARRFTKLKTLELYNLLNNMSSTGTCTLDMLASMTRDQLRTIVPLMERREPHSSYEFEYSYFTPEDIHRILETTAQQDGGVVVKGKFVAHYLQGGGCIKFAEIFWERFAGLELQVRLSDYEERFEDAVKFYEYFRQHEVESEDEIDYEETIRIPRSEFVSSPRNMKADFQNAVEEDELYGKNKNEL